MQYTKIFTKHTHRHVLIFFSMTHPLILKDPASFIDELEECVRIHTVQKRQLSSLSNTFIYKYADAPKIVGLKRLARGLIIQHNPPRFLNMPMPKFDEIASFDANVDKYHSNIENKLPEHVCVQPKHDGTCIHAIQTENDVLVTTFLSDDSPQVKIAKSILKNGKPWEQGITLGFELVHSSDPKVQTRRVADGLYLFYGARNDGTYLNRDDLQSIATHIGTVSLVKQQRLSASNVMKQLKRIDNVSSADDVQEGMVIIFPDGSRYKIKSWLYLQLSNVIKPSRTWLRGIVRKANNIEDIHNTVETFCGPMDLPLQAHSEFLKLLSECHTIIDQINTVKCDNVEEIKAQGPLLAPLLFEERKNPGFTDSDDGLLKVMKFVMRD